MIKIGFFGTKPWEKEYLEKKLSGGGGLEIHFSEDIINKDHAPEDTDFDAISVFVSCTVDRDVIKRLPKLKFVATRSTGFDHIDMVACKERGIVVSNVPSYGENTVAEFAFALILALSRKTLKASEQIRETGNFSTAELRGFDLKGKTLGVIGTGHIGRHVIRIGNGFDMKVVAHDSFPDKHITKELNFIYLPFDELLAKSDIITLHVPYSLETHHLINENTISKMKRGVCIINTSRGGVVDTAALLKGLNSGQIGGAGLDVLEEENVLKEEKDFVSEEHTEEHNLKTVLADHVLIDTPNVIVTPHNAFNTKEALERILDTTVENVSGFVSGKIVNKIK